MIERLFIFTKAQISSLAGGIVDYLTMILFTEVFHLHYTVSIAIGGVVGAIVNFSINHKWAFRSSKLSYKFPAWKQFSRFVLVVANSIILKATGTHMITTYLGINYKFSRIFTDMLVSIVFNYTLQRHWVFRRERPSIPSGRGLSDS
jgi:putative flippase GtrA